MVRDLDKLRTRSEFRLRTGHLALIVATSAIGAGVLFAVGTALAGQAPAGEEAAAADNPFAALDETPTGAKPSPAVATPGADPLGRLELRFHDRLAGGDSAARTEPPIAAQPFDAPLAAEAPAAAETPVPMPPRPPESAAEAPLAATPPALAAPPSPAPILPPPAYAGIPVAPVPLQATRQPAGPPLAPGPTEPAFDEEPVPPIAEPGSKGVFTLQTSTFYDQNEAVAFMNMLRLRGHESFLVRAHGPDRGFLYRVRVGPFNSQPEAERYRRRFERTERIPTFVVRRRLPNEE